MGYPTWLGDIPSWLTAAALGLSWWQFVHERSRGRHEQERLDRSQERIDREQAGKLIAWVAGTYQGKQRVGQSIILCNASDSVFHNVVVHARFNGADPAPPPVVVLPPGTVLLEHVPGGPLSGNWEWPKLVAEDERVWRPLMTTDRFKVVALAFSDSRQQRWEAGHDMVLRRVP